MVIINKNTAPEALNILGFSSLKVGVSGNFNHEQWYCTEDSTIFRFFILETYRSRLFQPWTIILRGRHEDFRVFHPWNLHKMVISTMNNIIALEAWRFLGFNYSILETDRNWTFRPWKTIVRRRRKNFGLL